MNNILKAQKLVDTFFAKNWWEKYYFHSTFSEQPLLYNGIKQFKNDLSELDNKIFEALNISILRGEYIEYLDFIESLQKLKTRIKNSTPFFNLIESEVSEILYTSNLRIFIKDIITAINHFLEFLVSVEKRLSISDKRYILKYNDEIISHNNEKQNYNIDIFLINLKIAEFDHFLDVENTQLPQLIAIDNLLANKFSSISYSSSIRLKGKYLSDKILLRRCHEYRPDTIFQLVNGVEVPILVTEMIKGGKFDVWLSFLSAHYELLNNWEEILKLEYEKLRNKELESCTLLELHRLIKYFKDVEKVENLNILVDINNEIKIRLKQAIADGIKCDIYAYSVALNYGINNQFSKLCDNNSTTLEDAESSYLNILRVQSETGIRNFYPQTKFLKYLLNKLKIRYENREVFKDIQDIRNLISKCQSLDELYKKNVNWSKRNYSFVFQLPFKECLVSNNGDNGIDRIYIHSTFLLPLPKENYLMKFEKNRLKVDQLEASIRIVENVETEIAELSTLKSEMQIIKDNDKARDFRLFEILGIFAAIISFVGVSLPTFVVIDSSVKAALFMVALSTSLAVFVLLILVVSRGIDKFIKHQKLIIIWIFAAIVLWIILIFMQPSEDKNIIKKEKSTTNQILPNLPYSLKDSLYVKFEMSDTNKIKNIITGKK